MRKPKVLVIMGTRPEVVKLAPVVMALRRLPSLDVVVCVTGQHAHMVHQMLEHFILPVDVSLRISRKISSLTSLASEVLKKLSVYIRSEQPRMIVVQGDTTSAMLGALAGFYEKIPVAHVEAGLRSFEMMTPFPEEFNRRLISLAAAVHFCPSRKTANNLLLEGVSSKCLRIVGNSCIDALLWTLREKRHSSSFTIGYRGILVTAHRRENWESGISSLCCILKRIVSEFPDTEILMPVHKNPIVQKLVRGHLKGQSRIRLIGPMSYPAFVSAMKDAYLIISDSGGVQEEALAIGTPTLVTRDLTERPEVLDGGTVKLVGASASRLWGETARLLSDKNYYRKSSVARFPFGKGGTGERIAKAIQSILNRSSKA